MEKTKTDRNFTSLKQTLQCCYTFIPGVLYRNSYGLKRQNSKGGKISTQIFLMDGTEEQIIVRDRKLSQLWRHQLRSPEKSEAGRRGRTRIPCPQQKTKVGGTTEFPDKNARITSVKNLVFCPHSSNSVHENYLFRSYVDQTLTRHQFEVSC